MTKICDLVEPIEAYRCWRGDLGTMQLKAASFEIAWQRDMIAQPCVRTVKDYLYGVRKVQKCDGPPCRGPRSHDEGYPYNVANGCGIYALRSLGRALLHLGFEGVIGKVLLAGKVWPHEHGWRAERAKIVGFYGRDVFERYDRYFEHKPLPAAMPWPDRFAIAYGVPLLEPTEAEHDQILEEARAVWSVSILEKHGLSPREEIPLPAMAAQQMRSILGSPKVQ